MDPWLESLEEVSREVGLCQADASERQRQVDLGQPPSLAAAGIRRRIEIADQNIARLERDLQAAAADPVGSRTTRKEVERRESLLAQVRGRASMVVQTLDSPGAAVNAERNALLGGSRGWSRAPARETRETQGRSEEDVLRLQRDVMTAQDKSLDAIHMSVQRQRELALAIGDETETSTLLIDDIGVKASRTNARMERENTRLQTFTKKANTGFIVVMCLAIFFLLAVLVGLLATDGGCYIIKLGTAGCS